MLTSAEIHRYLLQIGARFGIFQCQECAEEMRRWLIEHHVNAIHIQLVANVGDFIVSERVGSDIAIAQNGRHFGIDVNGFVFDNLPNSGMPKPDWFEDFDCIGGFSVVETQI